jgi:acetyl-CoA acetyltransferase
VSDACLCAAARTPFGRFDGALAGVRPDDRAATALTGLPAKAPALGRAAIGDVARGNANGAGEDDRNAGRMAAPAAGLPVNVPATTVDRLCGSGPDAAITASRTPVNPAKPRERTVSPGESNELLQEEFSISRERQDAFAARSHELADAAWDDGFHDDLGASGGRPLGTLAKVLRERRQRRGVTAVRIGVGRTLAGVLENVTDEMSQG